MNDPDSTGSERVVIYDARLTSLIHALGLGKHEKLVRKVTVITFSDWDIIDTIPNQY